MKQAAVSALDEAKDQWAVRRWRALGPAGGLEEGASLVPLQPPRFEPRRTPPRMSIRDPHVIAQAARAAQARTKLAPFSTPPPLVARPATAPGPALRKPIAAFEAAQKLLLQQTAQRPATAGSAGGGGGSGAPTRARLTPPSSDARR